MDDKAAVGEMTPWSSRSLGCLLYTSNCVGRLLIQGGAVNERRPTASQEVLGMVKRWSSLAGEPFEERLCECSWEMAMVIPVSAFFQHSCLLYTSRCV